jgi:RHS repeat-associated protein
MYDESYQYNADGARVVVSTSQATTLFVEGLWEEVVGGAVKSYYTLNGTPVAVRETSGSTSTLAYLHGDHLGSVSLVTDGAQGVVSQQEFDAWGKVRSGGVSQTNRNYTGQYLDGSGLLYYNARYYDPGIGRFISADTVVPGNASGGMDGVAVKPLTVGFHETQFLGKLNGENKAGFWFQLSDRERQQVGSPWGPSNPQALNRYSYVQNNPLKYTDPTGHTAYLSHDDAAYLAATLVALADLITSNNENWHYDALTLIAAATARLAGPAGAILAGMANGIDKFSWREIAKLREIASRIDEMNGAQGVALAGGANAGLAFNLWIMNRATGDMRRVQLGMPLYLKIIPAEWNLGIAYGEHPKSGTYYFRDDVDGTYLGSDIANCLAAGATSC